VASTPLQHILHAVGLSQVPVGAWMTEPHPTKPRPPPVRL